MATIKFKRGSGFPTGLTAYEAAWDTSFGRFFIHDGTTASWIGARIDNNQKLAGNCAFTVPTQAAVKTYIDDIVSGGITFNNGVTFATDITANSVRIGRGPGNDFRNTVVGNLALFANQAGGVDNTSIGYSSLYQNTSGDRNTAIGSGTLGSGQSGSDSTAIGYGALANSGFVAVGVFSTENANTAVGSQALSEMFNGGNNVALGADAGLRNANVSPMRSATGGIFIGYQAYASGNSQTNEIVIGTRAVGLGSNTAVIGATTQSAATIYGLLRLPSGISAAGATFTGNVTVNGSSILTSGNAVTSVNGATGAITNVAFTNTAQTFTGLQQFTTGISAAGITVSNIRNTGSLSLRGEGAAPSQLAIIGAASDSLTSIELKSANVVLGVNSERGSVQFNDPPSGFRTSVLAGSLSAANTITLPSTTGTLALVSGVATSVDGVTGAVDLLAGTGISITLPTGAAKGITLANTGVVGITGTANQVAVNATTGSVTLSLPNAITAPGTLTVTGNLTASSDLTVTGNLTVNGTSTTVNSTTVTVQDPLIAIGGLTGNIPPVSGDVKDRGILYQYFSTVGRTGFFGHDTSTGRFTYIPFVTSVSSDVVSGTAGIAEFSGIISPQRTLSLTGSSGAEIPAVIALNSGALSSSSTWTSSSHRLSANGAASGVALTLDSSTVDGFSTLITSNSTASNRAFTLPDIAGTAVVANAGGATSGWLLRAAGPSTQSTWVNPNAAGFTAFTSTNIITTSDTSDQVCFVTFVNTNTDGSQSLRYNSGFTYNAQTNYLEVNIDGGIY